jgi:hypothetical protein
MPNARPAGRRVPPHAQRVLARVRVLDLERLGQRRHAVAEEPLDPPRLLGHARLEVLVVAAVLEDQAAARERLAHARPHLVEVERLGEVVGRAHAQAAHRHLDVAHRGDHHHRRVGVPLAHAAEEGDAVDVRHAQVAHHERRRPRVEHAQRLGAVARVAALEPLAREHAREELPEPRLVVDHERARRLARGEQRGQRAVGHGGRRGGQHERRGEGRGGGSRGGGSRGGDGGHGGAGAAGGAPGSGRPERGRGGTGRDYLARGRPVRRAS